MAKNTTAEKAVKGKAAPAPKDKVTQRVLIFNMLAKAGKGGMTGSEIRDELGVKGIPNLLKDEGVSDKPRIRRHKEEGKRGVLYSLTAEGLKDHKAGKVDENAAPASGQVEWRDGM